PTLQSMCPKHTRSQTASHDTNHSAIGPSPIVSISATPSHSSSMAMIIAIAQSIRNDRRRSPIRLAELQQGTDLKPLSLGESQVPGLAVVIVGVRKDSQSYVSMKRKACAEVGIRSIDDDFPEQISGLDVVAKVHELNDDPARTWRKAVAASRGSSKKAEGEDNCCGQRGLWLRLWLRLVKMKAATTSRSSKKQGSSGGGRCDSKDGRGGWAALEGAETTALDLQAGRVSKAKGAVKAVAGRGGRKRAATVTGGWQYRQAVEEGWRRDTGQGLCKGGPGGSGDKATAEGCGSGDAAVRQWAAAADVGWSRGSSDSGEEWQVAANRWGTTSATGAGSERRKGEQGSGRRIEDSKAAGWPVATVAGVEMSTVDDEWRWWPAAEKGMKRAGNR
ncbi:hypothetical protein B296_00007836, partial [Ensete ventricosum]